MSSPEKKKRMEPSPTSTSLMSLPDDLLFNCLARVSRLYHPTLALVSKSFRSLLASPGLYKARSLFGNTESCLYVCIDSYSGPNPSWYTLCRKPNQTLKLAKVPIPDSPPNGCSLVAVGSSIYNIGGSESSNISILDCTSHMWATSLPAEIWPLSTSVLDRKIYVAGYYKDKDDSLKKSCKVLDTETQIWDTIPIPLLVTNNNFFNSIACVDGKLHVKTSGDLVIAYDSTSKKSKWEVVGRRMGEYMDSEDTYCVIENVLYSAFHNGYLRWYDTEVSEWKKLKGLVGLREFHPQACVRLVDYGGKLMVLWDEESSNCGKKIWCAEIKLEKKKCKSSCDIWGNVEWFDHVLTVPNLCTLVKGLTPTV